MIISMHYEAVMLLTVQMRQPSQVRMRSANLALYFPMTISDAFGMIANTAVHRKM